MRRLLLVALFAAWCAPLAAARAAGDAEAGLAKSSSCGGCHSVGGGYKTAFPRVYAVPYLRGQSVKYLESALLAYRDGGRSHPSMTAIAASLSDQDIADLAAYYGGEVAPAAAAGEAGDAQFPQCAACHGAGGNRPIADYPKLAGQRADYLEEAMFAYKRGRGDENGVWREHAVMAAQIALIGEETFAAEAAAFAAYFASRDGDLSE